MTDLNLTDLLLAGLTTYGSIALALTLLVGALGLPVPSTAMVVTAGTLAQQGIIDANAALGLGLLGAVGGDSLSYALGCVANGWVRRRVTQSPAWQLAQARFEQSGSWAVYLTRCLLTPLAIPTNLIAGGSGFKFGRFLVYDVAGELTWLVLFGGLGYSFAGQWGFISQTLNDNSGWLSGVGLTIIGLALVYWAGKPKIISELR